MLERDLPSCPICASAAAKLFRHGCKDFKNNSVGEWSLLECSECRVIYTFPRPQDLSAFYPPDYGPYRPCQPLRWGPAGAALRRLAKFPYTSKFGQASFVEPPFGRGQFLDIGCGAGGLLREMHAAGWKCWGVDFSPWAVDRARATVPEAKVLLGSIESVQLEGPFDLIAMCHVLEHLENPVDCLRRCFRWLAPSGKLVISLPNIGSIEARLFGRRWAGLDVPRHLVHFREPVIVRLLQDLGFRVEGVRPGMFASSISESIVLALPRQVRRFASRPDVSRTVYILSVLPAALSYRLGNRGTLEIFARKPT